MPIEISLLADRPDLIGQLAAAYEDQWPGWYGPGGRGDARADLEARARRDGVPSGVVAFEGAMAAGTCALAGESMSRGGEFGAWLVGLWVAPSHRRQGLAGRLMDAAVAQAVRLGIAEVRAGTVGAEAVFERAGWRRTSPILHEGQVTQVFAVNPPPRLRGA